MFLPRVASDDFIKQAIKGQVKATGKRWNGKFERKPELLDKHVEMTKKAFDNTEKAKLLRKMNFLTERLI